MSKCPLCNTDLKYSGSWEEYEYKCPDGCYSERFEYGHAMVYFDFRAAGYETLSTGYSYTATKEEKALYDQLIKSFIDLQKYRMKETLEDGKEKDENT